MPSAFDIPRSPPRPARTPNAPVLAEAEIARSAYEIAENYQLTHIEIATVLSRLTEHTLRLAISASRQNGNKRDAR